MQFLNPILFCVIPYVCHHPSFKSIHTTYSHIHGRSFLFLNLIHSLIVFVFVFFCVFLGLVPVPVHDPPLRVIGSIIPSHMQSTFYPMPLDLLNHQCKGMTDREMLSMAVQIKLCPETRRKRIRVAAGVQLTTLRHHFSLPQHTWLTQLTDMFDVEVSIFSVFTFI